MSTTVAGTPRCFDLTVNRVPQQIASPQGKEVCLQNVGTNTIWISIDNSVTWFPVACGTAWDVRAEINQFLLRTKIGSTKVILMVTT